ncbi:MAG: hypothetical protein VB095_09430 [Anaerovorax sp.]|nr:hypothetical protein [Anaerovorax sp.]
MLDNIADNDFDMNSIVNKTETRTIIDEAGVMPLLENYLSENPKIGYLVFQVFQNSALEGVLPIANATITLCKDMGDDYYISKVLRTNEDGKTDQIAMRTVSANLSQSPDNDKVFTTYDAYIEAPNFLPASVEDIPIFEGITTIQPVSLIPNYGFAPTPSYEGDLETM